MVTRVSKCWVSDGLAFWFQNPPSAESLLGYPSSPKIPHRHPRTKPAMWKHGVTLNGNKIRFSCRKGLCKGLFIQLLACCIAFLLLARPCMIRRASCWKPSKTLGFTNWIIVHLSMPVAPRLLAEGFSCLQQSATSKGSSWNLETSSRNSKLHAFLASSSCHSCTSVQSEACIEIRIYFIFKALLASLLASQSCFEKHWKTCSFQIFKPSEICDSSLVQDCPQVIVWVAWVSSASCLGARATACRSCYRSGVPSWNSVRMARVGGLGAREGISLARKSSKGGQL